MIASSSNSHIREYQPGDVVRVVAHRTTATGTYELLPIGSEHVVDTDRCIGAHGWIPGYPISSDPATYFLHIVELVRPNPGSLARSDDIARADRIGDQLAAMGLPITSGHRAVILAGLNSNTGQRS